MADPLVAICAAARLGYHRDPTGPLITISFQTAEGLEAGKTRCVSKDVDVRSGRGHRAQPGPETGAGACEAGWQRVPIISMTTPGSGWRVHGFRRPRCPDSVPCSAAASSRLTCRPRAPQDTFVGLETPPIVTATEPGRTFTLTADALRFR